MGRAVVAASDPVAKAGGEAILSDGGSASDAIVTGILAASAVHSDVLLAPLVAMVGGVGAGARLFDGRTCQPGLGEKRPRGFTEGDPIPPAARCGVPRSVATLALIHHYSTQRPLSALVRCARVTARQWEDIEDGLDARLAVLDTFLEQGAASLALLKRELLHVAGLTAGGLWSLADLQQTPVATPAEFRAAPDREIAVPSFAEPEPEGSDPTRTQTIVAADGRGLVAAACYTPSAAGVLVPELGLSIATSAVPVLRGVPRVTPGTPLWAPHPIALQRRTEAGWFAAAADGGPIVATEGGRTSLLPT